MWSPHVFLVVPGHETHSRWGKVVAVVGVVVSIVLIIELLHLGVREATAFGLGLGAATLVGASLPDVDHKDSIPRRKLGKTGLYLAPLAVVGLLIMDDPVRDVVVLNAASILVDETPLSSETVAQVVIASVLVTTVLLGFLHLLDRMKHRGVLHSPVTAFVAGGLLVYLGIGYFDLDGSIAEMAVIGAGVGLAVGYLTHLWLDDEIVRQ